MKMLRAGVGAAALVLAVGMVAGPATASEQDDRLGANLTSEELALFDSDAPKVVVMNASTGVVTSVEPAAPEERAQIMGVSNGCSSTQPCWQAYTTPYANFGFSGSGASGTWTNRGNFYTKNRTAKLTWNNGVTGPWLPKNSVGQFSSYPVTGKRVQLGS